MRIAFGHRFRNHTRDRGAAVGRDLGDAVQVGTQLGGKCQSGLPAAAGIAATRSMGFFHTHARTSDHVTSDCDG
jgi:hypothetical protein